MGKSVTVDDYVWIASRVTILLEINVGKGAVAAACSVVTYDVDSYTIVADVPAKEIGKRQENLSYKLGGIRKWFC